MYKYEHNPITFTSTNHTAKYQTHSQTKEYKQRNINKRSGCIKNMSKEFNFTQGIVSYDFHTYYRQTHPTEPAKARNLISKLRAEFGTLIESEKIRIYKFHDNPLGPHPIGMVECDVRDADSFLKMLMWFQMNHDGLSVLIHPRSGKGDLLDHTEHALWLGEKQQLITEFLHD